MDPVVEKLYLEKEFARLERSLGVCFQDKSRLVQSFIHRSFLNEHVDLPLKHNERLEFLGDAVLEMVVTEHLYRQHRNPEGELTRWRAALVNTQVLAEVGRKHRFQDYLFLSRGESNEQIGQNVLADAVEALIGAIYLDQGREQAERFIESNILDRLPESIDSDVCVDAKSRLQENVQVGGGEAPRYEVLETQGPDHDKKFKVGVMVEGRQVGVGQGSSKQRAEQAAAEEALKYFRKK